MPPSPLALTIIAAATSFGSTRRREAGEPGVDVLLDAGARTAIARARAPSGRARRCPSCPATWTPGRAAAVPVPPVTTPDHQAAKRRRGLRRGHPNRAGGGPERPVLDHGGGAADAPVGDRLRDRCHLQRRRQHLALADRGHPEVEVVRGSRSGSCSRAGPSPPGPALSNRLGGRVEAVPLGRADEALRADLRPQRDEDAVARLGERLDEGSAAGLVVARWRPRVRSITAEVWIGN